MSLRLNPYCDPRLEFPNRKIAVRKIGTRLTKDAKVASTLVRGKDFALPDYLEITNVTSYQLMDDYYFAMLADVDRGRVAFLPVHEIEYTTGPRIFSIYDSKSTFLGKVSEDAKIRIPNGVFRPLKALNGSKESIDLIVANRISEDTLSYSRIETRIVLHEEPREPVASISLWDPYGEGNKFKFLPITLASGVTVI